MKELACEQAGYITRRGFLGVLACLVACKKPKNVALIEEAVRVPGEKIEIPWPPFFDPGRAKALVMREGKHVGYAPTEVTKDSILVEARPPPPVLPGQYEFFLAVGPFRFSLGGFRIARFYFGC